MSHCITQKPLRRIVIEEVGLDDEQARTGAAIIKTQDGQGRASRQQMAREAAEFSRFQAPSDISSPADIARLSVRDSGENGVGDNRDSEREESVSVSETGVNVQVMRDNHNVVTEHSASAKSSQLEATKQNRLDTRTLKSNPSADPAVRKLPSSVPTTSVQFQADFRLLRHDTEAFYQYFKVSCCGVEV